MKCRITITSNLDIAALVNTAVFNSNVDLRDLACRDTQKVRDVYHPKWFCNIEGVTHFRPPAFAFRNGHLMGINGRHRAVLLSRHMEHFPILLVCPQWFPKGKLDEIIHTKLYEGAEVDLPDLPIDEGLRIEGEPSA